ncbi:Mechanosensitive ion channel protein 10-like protein [Drosera capensis]
MDTGNAMDSFIKISAADAIIVNFGIKVPNDPSPMPTTSKTHSEAVFAGEMLFLESQIKIGRATELTKQNSTEGQHQHPKSCSNHSPNASDGGDPGIGEDDDTDVYMATLQSNPMRSKKKKNSIIMEWTMFVALTALLVASLTVHRLIESKIWSLELWKWFVLAMVMFCGRLINDHGVKRSRKTTKDLHYITMGLAGLVVGAGAGIWLVKTGADQDSLFHQYVLRALSGSPMKGMARKIGINARTTTMGKLSFKGGTTKKEEVIDIDRLNRLKQEKVSAWAIRGLINVITGTRLLTTSSSLHDGVDDDEEEQTTEITSQWEAKSAAYQIFENVAKPGYKYIEEDGLRRLMKKEDVDHVFPLFEGATESGKIKKSALTKWVVNAYLEQKYLVHSLNDTKTAVEELNRMASGIALVVNIIMVVDEMNILTTIFLRYDIEKITCPNSVLATKPISNFYRSPEMSNSVEFAVDFSTSEETTSALKARIKEYIDSKSQHWRPNFSVQVKEFQDMDKMKMGLYVTKENIRGTRN